MAITDELMEWMYSNTIDCSNKRMALSSIVCRIDAAHEKAMSRAGQLLADAEKERDYNYANWQECKQKVLQQNITLDELSAEIERLKDELDHRVELPKDADGEYIHIGDELDDSLSRAFAPKKVKMLMLEDDEWALNFGGGWCSMKNHEWRHHKQPTVEDVLRDFAEKWLHTADGSGRENAVVAEYAKRLRLAGSDAE